MGRVKTPSYRRWGGEKKTSLHIPCECTALDRVRIQTLITTRMDPNQIKEVRLGRATVIVEYGVGLLNSLL